VHLKFPRFKFKHQSNQNDVKDKTNVSQEDLHKERHTNLRINFSKHQNASASSLSSTIIGEHKSLIPV
jgi:hypothetical protein